LNVLQFIDEQNQCGAGLRGPANDLKQCLQIVLQIAVIREPRLGVEINADLDVLVFDLKGFANRRALRAR
jgi:hypothetical protein